MNMKVLKWIAIVTMTIDHIGGYLLPQGSVIQLVFRSIGRIAYPLFALMIAEGYRHSHDVRKYLLRLLAAALAVEAGMVILYFATGINYLITINVFWPLVFGLGSLMLLGQRRWYLQILVLPLLLGSLFLEISYGLYGVLLIIAFGLIQNKWQRIAGFLLICFIFINWPLLDLLGWQAAPSNRIYHEWIQWFSVLALVPITLYNGRLGHFNKWLFYLYYPIHLGIILIIQFLITY
ncbi:MAG: TraX family protein [bacterium]